MQITWNGSTLALEPETDVEAEALLVVLAGLKHDGPPPEGSGQSPASRIQTGLGQVERGEDVEL